MEYFKMSFLILVTSGCVMAQNPTNKFEWKATLRAVDESGNPIVGADAQIGYYANSRPANANGVTDTNGRFSFSHSSLSTMAEVSCQAAKAGYYTTWVRREMGPQYDVAQWSFTQTLVLKKVGHAIGMYAKSVNLGMPVFDKPVGFDLAVGDWVAPYGKGMDADILFEAHLERRDNSDAEYSLTVAFPRNGDGIQDFTVPEAERGSALRSPHEAPKDGYQPQWVQTRNRRSSQPEAGNFDASRNYMFRVRTVLDQQGNVLSAQYGKIYGDFLQFTYYLNPTPNDRNIEFDPKQNLLRGLQSFERASAP